MFVANYFVRMLIFCLETALEPCIEKKIFNISTAIVKQITESKQRPDVGIHQV